MQDYHRRLYGKSVGWCIIYMASFLLVCPSLFAQNLAPNPSFETYTTCPLGLGMGGALPAVPWLSPITTSDYFNGCADPLFCGVPINFQGFQYAHTGFAYTGMYFYIQGNYYREYIQAQLLQPLQADSCYLIGFYMNLADEGCGCNHTGALLSVTPPTLPFPGTPQLDWGGQFFSDTAQWIYVFDYYKALGGEQYITIGNFHPDAQTSIDPACPYQFQYAYYYVDDVIVQKTQMEDIVVDLGGPVTACDSYVIDPGLSGVSLTWSTGAHSPTLTVTTSGTYSVTASYACEIYEASIDVTILGDTPVDIGPAQVNLCTGETYTISLDDNAGTYEWSDGSTNAEYTISAAGTYSVTLDDGCGLTSDTVEVSVTSPPDPFELGQDTFLCPGEMLQYQFDPTLGDFHWQNNSTSSNYTIDDAGTYALTISNICGQQSDEINIAAIVPPAFSLGPDSVVLCGQDVLDFHFDPGLGDFTWQDGSTGSSYTIEGTGLYSLTVSNACGTLSENIYATQEDFPQFFLGLDEQLCPGDTLVLDGGINTGVYTWQDGSHASTYIVHTAGTYSLTVTNDCGMATGDILVDYFAPVTPPDLGPDFSLCPGEHAVLDLGNIQANHVWNNNSTADTLLITTAGTYSVHVFNACESYRDTVVVTLQNSPPVLSLPVDFYLCQGQTTTLDAGVNNVTYQWNDGSQQSQLTVSVPGLYSLTVSNACGADSDSVLISDGGAAPVVSLGEDTSICSGNTFILTPEFANVDTWTWQDGSTDSLFTVTSPGLVYVDVTNHCGTSSDSLSVGLLPAVPVLSLGPDTAVCPGETVTLSITIPGVDILWPDGSSNPDFTISDSATIYASISNVCGVSTDSLEVTLLPEVPSLNLGPDQTICPGETFTIDPGIQDVSYLWQDGSTDSTFEVTQEGLISLTISNTCGMVTDSVLVTESTDGPQLDLGPDIQVCQGETVRIPSNISGVSFLWQDGSTGNEFITNVSGTFILMVSNSCGTDRDTINVDISGVPPEPDLGPDTTLCEGKSLLLTSNLDSSSTWNWQDGSTGPTFLVVQPGTYSLHATNRCGDGNDSVVVAFMKGPEPFDLGPDTVLCPGESFVLSAPATPFEMEWQDGSTSPTILADDDITYKLRIRNSCGVKEDSLKVTFDQNIPKVTFDSPVPWCPEDMITLDASQSFAATYLWNTGETTPAIVVSNPGIYSVDVGALCATASDTAELVLMEDCGQDDDIYIPNVFTPNDDNVNDVFTLYTGTDLEFITIQGTIFDRWGNMIFQSTDIPFVWNGRFHEDMMMPGVYVYVFTVTYRVGGNEYEKVLSGDVTLVR